MATKKSSGSVPVIAMLAILHSAGKGKDIEGKYPWYLYIPCLGVAMRLVRDEDDSEITGFLNKRWASVVCQNIVNQLTTDKEYLTKVRANPESAVLASAWDKLGTIINIVVYVPEGFKV